MRWKIVFFSFFMFSSMSFSNSEEINKEERRWITVNKVDKKMKRLKKNY